MNTALKWRLAAGFLLVFIASRMTGAFIWSSHARHLFLGPPHSGALAHRMGERWRSELGLTPDQFTKIAPIIHQTASKLETMADAHQQMAADLTPEQPAKPAAVEQQHRQHSRHRGFPPP